MGGPELLALTDEERFERVHPLPGEGRYGEDLEARFDLQGLSAGPGRVERKMGDEVGLGQDEDVGGEERLRVLLRLIVPFGR